jgi:hypothetical protein
MDAKVEDQGFVRPRPWRTLLQLVSAESECVAERAVPVSMRMLEFRVDVRCEIGV